MPNTPSFVDTHCHIDSILERDQIHWDQLQQRLSVAPPEKIIHVACHPDQMPWADEFAAHHPHSFCVYGVHPHEAQLYNPAVEQQLRHSLALPHTVALGEIGLDYHYEYSPRDVQQNVFIQQLAIAKELSLPVVLHTREAEADTLRILKEWASPHQRFHVHCYTGSPEFAQQLMALPGDYYFGFTGVITFKNAENVRESARCIPNDRLLLETDGPYLAPIPWRGQTAHSAMIPTIAAALAQVRQQSTETVLDICRENTRRFYGI